MKTDDEILARIEAVKLADPLGIQIRELRARLPFDKALPYLPPDATADSWAMKPRDRDALLDDMLDYMPIALDKANNGKIMSAGRSMDYYIALTWLAGDDVGDLDNCRNYGKDNLLRICQHYGWDASQWDDGQRYEWRWPPDGSTRLAIKEER